MTRLTSVVDLLEAVDDEQITVVFQGIYDLASGRARSFEALIRWDHPNLGVLPPAEFLPDDMGGGLGWALTNLVLEESIRACARWRSLGLDAGVSVNISPGHLAGEMLPSLVASLLNREGLPAQALTVEITEQRCELDPAGIRSALHALSRLGVRISLDDFGMGESSLGRLQQFHFDEIKIDRSFVERVAEVPTDRHIITFATQLANNLGSQVVAEGIETLACLSALRAAGVDCGQGYLLHRPGPAELLPAVGGCF